MHPDSPRTPEQHETPTRRSLRAPAAPLERTIHARRTEHDRMPIRRFFGQKTLFAAAILTTGLVVGSGFVVQTTAASITQANRVADTQLTERALAATVQKSAVVANAQNTIARASRVAEASGAKVDTSGLNTSLASLSNYPALDPDTIKNLTVQTEFASQNVQAAADQADRIAAEAAAAAAAKAAADAAAAAQAAAEALAASNTVDGAKATAENLASSQYGWGSDQFSCLVSLWQKESGWSYQAHNSSSGAAGIPQALPGSKMSSVADDWQTNATTQITWGLKYIASSYGTPCSAWSHSQSVNWY